MRYIENGVDRDGVPIWIVLEDAELIGIFYSESEAEEQL